ncbi:hypothetical protein Zmor_015010 [Zophobas morio]|uniref:Nuclease HARBI1 n=1 Tax=Zophobas morio TaxID=2755281 RepID=A0AA38ILB8_9CUCU|nr:hypothetical protein Zmor_015010 [Zophobas morio]
MRMVFVMRPWALRVKPGRRHVYMIYCYPIIIYRNPVQALIVACAVLHKIACELNDEAPDDINEDVEREIAAAIIDDDIIEDNRAHNVNNIVRQTLINQYFENLL